MTLDTVTFQKHLTGLVEQSTDPVLFSSIENARFIVAYSGGLDSHVLLHLMQACHFNTLAVYIDHGLQDESNAWSEHCASVCNALDVSFQSISVNAHPGKGQSPEASARGSRYQALADVMKAGDILLTAQHLQDQAETFILQMLRTAGPDGLSAMPAVKEFAAGFHLRPLLINKRSELEDYAAKNQLKWIEDPSNKDESYDRNFLRQSVLPLFQKRWPSIHQTLSNVSLLQAEASEIMNDLAAIDAKSLIDEDKLDIEQLIRLSLVRQKNVIRYWLQQSDLDIPTSKRLQEIIGSMLTAADDKSPVVSWSQTEVRRFQGKLYAMPMISSFDTTQQISWDGMQPEIIQGLAKQVYFEKADSGLSEKCLNETLTIRFRQGGEKIKPAGRKHTMDLKKLMQQEGIPPWVRPRIPLLYLDDKLIAVADFWVADEYKSDINQSGWQLKTLIL